MRGARALLVLFSLKSPVACCGVIRGGEGRDVVEEGRGALTSSPTGGERAVTCAEGGHPWDASCAPPPTPCSFPRSREIWVILIIWDLL